MRTTTTLTRRAAAVALAGALAFGVSACSDDDGADDAASEVEEGVDDAESEVSEMATEMESEMESEG
jgi:hypothetical protein